MRPWVRRVLERVRIVRPRRGRQEVWAAIDRGELSPAGDRVAPGPEIGGGMMNVADPSRVRSVEVSAVVVRADGRQEWLGVISRYDEEA